MNHPQEVRNVRETITFRISYTIPTNTILFMQGLELFDIGRAEPLSYGDMLHLQHRYVCSHHIIGKYFRINIGIFDDCFVRWTNIVMLS